MVEISVFCQSCGGRIQAEFDEDSPPPFLTCTCGNRYAFGAQPEPVEEDAPPRESAAGCKRCCYCGAGNADGD